MAQHLELDLPLPSSVNHLYVRRGSRVVKRPEAQVYIGQAIVAARGGRRPPPGARLRLDIVFRVPDNRRRDLDNMLKLLCDAVALALEFDDSQIDELSVKRQLDPSNPGAAVVVSW